METYIFNQFINLVFTYLQCLQFSNTLLEMLFCSITLVQRRTMCTISKISFQIIYVYLYLFDTLYEDATYNKYIYRA